MFSKRHFEAIAKLIKETDASSKYQLAQELGDLFAEDNERFDVKRFFTACGFTLERA